MQRSFITISRTGQNNFDHNCENNINQENCQGSVNDRNVSASTILTQYIKNDAPEINNNLIGVQSR